MRLTPEFKETAKMHLKNIRTAAWVLSSEVLAPAIIIGTIGAAARLSNWQFLFYMLAANVAWWRILGALKRRPIFNFRIQHITHLPAEYCCPKGQEPAAMQKMSDAAAAQETK